jgi:hypothetical protein
MINVADMVNPESGKTWREENAEKTHAIPLGTLVEIYCGQKEVDGLRLFVVFHGRDCDQSPLYFLSHLTVEKYQEAVANVERLKAEPDPDYPGLTPFYKGIQTGCRTGGYGESSLKVIHYPDSEVRYRVAWVTKEEPHEFIDFIFGPKRGKTQDIFETRSEDEAVAFLSQHQIKHPNHRFQLVTLVNDED